MSWQPMRQLSRYSQLQCTRPTGTSRMRARPSCLALISPRTAKRLSAAPTSTIRLSALHPACLVHVASWSADMASSARQWRQGCNLAAECDLASGCSLATECKAEDTLPYNTQQRDMHWHHRQSCIRHIRVLVIQRVRDYCRWV
jgi:hypothetical protein